MRVVACFLVVLTHSQMSNKAENGIYVAFLSFLCTPSSEMFLMLSGAILLPVHTDTQSFYKRRFLKLLPPMIFWSLFSIILRYIQGSSTIEASFEKLIFLPFKPVEGVYWFLYVMVGLYLFAPIISQWLNNASRKSVEFFLLIWMINMILPWFELFSPGFYHQDGSYYWVFCNFGGFLGYWILGYYLRKYSPTFRSSIGLATLALSATYTIAVLYLKLKGVDTAVYTDNLQFGSAAFVSLLYILLKALSDSNFGKKYLNRRFSVIAQYSFGIYLLHIFVIRDLVWTVFDNFRLYSHPIVEALLIALISMGICMMLIIAVKKIYDPAGMWLFGVNKSKIR